MIRRCKIGGLATGLALLLAGCGTGLNPDGPFGRSTAGVGSQCFWTVHNEVGTFAALAFGNSGSPARIDKVTLVGSRHLRIVAAWAVPITGTDLLGVFQGYPPYGTNGFPGPLAPGVQWGHRQRADGAVIPHIPGQNVINLVLVLKPSGKEGTAKTEYVYYQSGSTHYLLNMGVGIQVFNGNERGCH